MGRGVRLRCHVGLERWMRVEDWKEGADRRQLNAARCVAILEVVDLWLWLELFQWQPPRIVYLLVALYTTTGRGGREEER